MGKRTAANASASSVEQIVSVASPLPKCRASSRSRGGIEVEGEQVAGQVEKVAAVVGVPDAREHVAEDDLAIGRAQPDRAADANVEVDVLEKRRDDDALLDEGLDDQEA